MNSTGSKSPRNRSRGVSRHVRCSSRSPVFLWILVLQNVLQIAYFGQYPKESSSISSTMSFSLKNARPPTKPTKPTKRLSCPSLLSEDAPPPMSGNVTHHHQTGKPYFILHIGPSKTGTTTLQKDSVRMQSTLMEDHYVYLGRHAPQQIRRPSQLPHLFLNDDCLQQAANTPSNPPECWIQRINKIKELYHSRNISIVVSDEALSYERQVLPICTDPRFLPTVLSALSDWNVRVVVTYRRYAEWLLSGAKETNQKYCLDGKRPEGQWNGVKCSLYRDLVQKFLKPTSGVAFGYANWDTSVLAWKQHGIPVQIMNLHTTNSLTTTFYCDVVPNAPKTCQQSRNEHPSRENAKHVMTTAYNDIVFDAAQAGLLGEVVSEMTRQEFVSKVEEQGVSMGLQLVDLPLLCPPRSNLNELLQKSLLMERILWGSDGEAEHTREFWELADTRKEFCSVDTQRLLEGKSSWEQVMEYLHRLAGKHTFGLID